MARNPQARSIVKRDGGDAQSDNRDGRRVLIVVVPPLRTLDLFGPLEVFSDANRLSGADPVYKVSIISGGANRVVLSHLATPVYTDLTFREYRGSVDTLLVAGVDSDSQIRYEADFLDWLRDQSQKSRRFGSICTGALILAKAGLLDGRRAATHWNWCSELAQDYPKVTVDPDPIYVRDGNCYTSAGVTAGIDLALALVEEDLGRSVALRVARMMVVFLVRQGGQSQFSATLAAQTCEHRPLAELLARLPENIRRHLSVDKLAQEVGMSPRNFARLFRQQVGKTPGRHIEDLRLEAARRQLESTSRTLDEVAAASGFGSAEILRRVFNRRLGVTPARYRASFRRTGLR
ncbi:MAG: GlxA family transcriptional regulator [Verrucomicrobia bacterium]|nr:GlxA family transcriptional regulator [Verrucomicrobiota bacterium]MBV8481736.1 GlxA family transcriptional regulator [Verrucomicrobiota bacterium]